MRFYVLDLLNSARPLLRYSMLKCGRRREQACHRLRTFGLVAHEQVLVWIWDLSRRLQCYVERQMDAFAPLYLLLSPSWTLRWPGPWEQGGLGLSGPNGRHDLRLNLAVWPIKDGHVYTVYLKFIISFDSSLDSLYAATCRAVAVPRPLCSWASSRMLGQLPPRILDSTAGLGKGVGPFLPATQSRPNSSTA